MEEQVADGAQAEAAEQFQPRRASRRAGLPEAAAKASSLVTVYLRGTVGHPAMGKPASNPCS